MTLYPGVDTAREIGRTARRNGAPLRATVDPDLQAMLNRIQLGPAGNQEIDALIVAWRDGWKAAADV